MNKVILIGNLTKEPENNVLNGGVSVTRLSIAVTRKFSKTNETDYFNVTTWRNIADACAKYLKKGSKVAISGSLQTRTYEDKSGITRFVTEINADEVEFLSSKNNQENQNSFGTEVNESLPF